MSPSSTCAMSAPPFLAAAHRSVSVWPLRSSPGSAAQSSPQVPRGIEGAWIFVGWPWQTVSQWPRPRSCRRCFSVFTSATAEGATPSIQRPARPAASAFGASSRSCTATSKYSASGTSKTTQPDHSSLEVQEMRAPLARMFRAERMQNFAGGPCVPDLLRTRPPRRAPRSPPAPSPAAAGGASCAARCTSSSWFSASLTGSVSFSAGGASEPLPARKMAWGFRAPAVASSTCALSSAPVVSLGSASS
mmetsp:Transcript_44045/g.140307  ORF Transcript_44045/g.140307 Transcript_44045/m.140307 type:complete len:247 (-) Transcript_44045:379-1119(-)